MYVAYIEWNTGVVDQIGDARAEHSALYHINTCVDFSHSSLIIVHKKSNREGFRDSNWG